MFISDDMQLLASAQLSKLAEGPVWDARRNRFYWVDITAGELHWLDRTSDERSTVSLESTIGFVSLTDEPDTVVLGCGDSLVKFDLTTKEQTQLVTLDADGPGFRCNDGKCDPTGRLWAGTMPLSSTGSRTGSLYSMEYDGTVNRRLRGIGCSNGMAWNVGSGLFYYIDSLARRIDRFHWNCSTGEITAETPLTTFTIADGLPDGMCIDAEGHLWVAFWDGGCIRQIDARSGATLLKIKLPVTRVTSCTFGGPDLSTLYITTAAEGLSSSECAAQPGAGGVFICSPGSRGMPPALQRMSRSPVT